jgi:hypothetical protein
MNVTYYGLDIIQSRVHADKLSSNQVRFSPLITSKPCISTIHPARKASSGICFLSDIPPIIAFDGPQKPPLSHSMFSLLFTIFVAAAVGRVLD